MTGTERDLPTRLLGAAAALGDGVLRLARSSYLALLRWQDLERQRRQLLDMDERTLKDIGLTHWQARRMASRIARDELERLLRERF